MNHSLELAERGPATVRPRDRRTSVSRCSVADAVAAVRAPLALLDELRAVGAARRRRARRAARRRRALEPLLARVPSLVGLAEGLDADALGSARRLSPTSDGAARARGRPQVARGHPIAAGRRRSSCSRGCGSRRDIAREMWEHTDFTMLFDPHRELFSIGYNLAEGRLDHSYYDLLASECRLASFLAIAKGDVPQEHWFRLGRSLTQTRKRPRARVVVRVDVRVPHAAARHARLARDAARPRRTTPWSPRRSSTARPRGVPWGVSRVGVQRQGRRAHLPVPGVRRARPRPEARAVRRRRRRARTRRCSRCPIDPRAVLANLAAFSRGGRRGALRLLRGARLHAGPRARRPARARSSRATSRTTRAWRSSRSATRCATGACASASTTDPMVGSAELLLQERVPRHIQLVTPHVEEVEFVRSVRELPPPVSRSYPLADTPVAGDALPVQRPLLGHGHQRRRRLLALERRRGHALPRGRHARLLGHVLLRAGHRERRGLLGAVQPAPAPARSLQRRLRARQGRVPPARRRPRDAHRGRRSRPKTTSRSAASPSRTTASRRARSRSRATSRSR